MRLSAFVVALFLLAGCAQAPAPEPKVITQNVNMPVAVSCVVDTVPAAPSYVDTDAALTAPVVDGPRRYQLVTAGREQRINRLALLEALIAECRKAPHLSPGGGK